MPPDVPPRLRPLQNGTRRRPVGELRLRPRVEFARGRLVHRQNLARHGIALQPLLDEDDLQVVGHLRVEVEADRRGPVPVFVIFNPSVCFRADSYIG